MICKARSAGEGWTRSVDHTAYEPKADLTERVEPCGHLNNCGSGNSHADVLNVVRVVNGSRKCEWWDMYVLNL